MDILFINPSLRPESKRRQLPVGLAYIMTAVKKAGFDFDLIDMDINQLSMHDLGNLLSKKSYDLYALGCIVTGYRYVKDIADIIKKTNPDSVIVAGNSVATSIPDILLRNTKVDIAVIGEGDITIAELLHTIDNNQKITDVNGIAFKENGNIRFTKKQNIIPNLDDVGFPEWKIFELEKYDKYAEINVNSFHANYVLAYPLNSARGCPFNCTFCYHVFKNEKYRKYSEDAITGEIKRLHDKYNCNYVSFWDELTFKNTKSVEMLVEKLGKLDFEIGWDAPVRGNLFKAEDVELIKEMKNSGCDNISFSLENASAEILKAINKKLDVSQFIEQAKTLKKGGVVPLTSVIFGYPQETRESIAFTLKVCEECGIFPSVGFLLPLPGTPIYNWAKENKFITDELEYLERVGDRQDFHINLTKMSDQELLDVVETGLRDLAKRQGLKLDSVFKTTTYQKPETDDNI